MYNRPILGLKESLEAIQVMIKEMESKKEYYWQHGAVAVVDYAGCLTAFAKMDGGTELAVTMAIRKAFTAAVWGFSTSELRRLVKDSNGDMMSWGPNYTIAKGGIPIVPPSITELKYDSDAFPHVVGAIGAAHIGAGEVDAEVAMVGVKYLQSVLWPSK